MADTLLENGIVVTVNARSEVFSPGYIFIQGDRITEVGAGQMPEILRGRAGRVVDAAGKIIMPGLINAHVHVFQTFVRGLADDQPLLQWLENIVWPVFSHMTQEDVYLAALVGMIENIHGGATALIDNHYVHISPFSDDAVCRAAVNTGIRYQLARGWADTNYHAALMESPDRIFEEMARLHDTWHGQADGRLRVAFGPLIPWGCTDSSMLRMYALAQQWGTMIQMHTAETQAEVTMNVAARGKRHVQWLADLGILGPHFMLVHAVWLDEKEIEVVAKSGATVVHCPVSNMFLASGIAPVVELRRLGVPVGLATDGQACNNGQEMIDLLKWTANLHKVRSNDPLALSAEEILRMACMDGARAFGEPKLLGSLEAGKKADLILVDASASRMMSGLNPSSTVVNFATSNDVDTVIVNGEIIMEDKRLIQMDEDAVLAEARHARQRLLWRAGIISA